MDDFLIGQFWSKSKFGPLVIEKSLGVLSKQVFHEMSSSGWTNQYIIKQEMLYQLSIKPNDFAKQWKRWSESAFINCDLLVSSTY